MVLAVFPAGIPQSPLMSGLEFKKVRNSIEFETEVGDSIGRRRFTGKRKMIPMTLPQMTLAQKTSLDTFYDTTLLDGTLAFTWKDFETGDTGVTYKFQGPPSFKATVPDSSNDMQWKVTFTLFRIY